MLRIKSKSASISAAIAFLLVSADVVACGESLFRVGRGVPYRDYTAPIPGKILVVAVTDVERANVELLAAAGHDIQVLEDASDIGAALANGSFDIVMTYYDQHEIVATQLPESGVRYLPVARAHTSEEDDARTLNRHAPNTEDGLKSFLKAIHRTLRDARA